jgi:hypothetical protein
MGYKQKGFSKHATKSAYKRVDDIETQNLISNEIKNILESGGTDKDVREYVNKKSDLATTYYYDEDGNVRTSARVNTPSNLDVDDMNNLYKVRKKDGKYDYDEVDGEKVNKFDEVPMDEEGQHLQLDEKGQIKGKVGDDGKITPSKHEWGGSRDRPKYISKVLKQDRRYDSLDDEDFSGF